MDSCSCSTAVAEGREEPGGDAEVGLVCWESVREKNNNKIKKKNKVELARPQAR